MELLEVPPEILQGVMQVYVKNVGIVEAWKIRGTCKTFRSYIDYEVFAKPSTYAYTKSAPGRTILKNNMAQFLSYRANNLRGARSLLPQFIRDMVAEVMKAGEDNNSDIKQNYIKTLSTLLVKSFDNTYFCITTNTSKGRALYKAQNINIGNEANRVAAAAALGNRLALKKFTGKNRPLLWKRSTAFGRPLSAAAYSGQLHVVKKLVKMAMLEYDAEDYLSKVFTPSSLTDAMCNAIERKHGQIALYLLNSYDRAFGAIREECLEQWLLATVRAGNPDLLRLFLIPRTHGGATCIYAAFKLSCQLDLPTLSRIFFESGVLKIDEVVGSSYPLKTAIEHSSILVVKELLDLWASPDGPRYFSNSSRPLGIALTTFQSSICCLLLEKGADPYKITISWQRYKTLFRDHRDLRMLLWEAVKESDLRKELFTFSDHPPQ